MLFEHLVNKQSLPLCWSTESCATNFRETYKVFEGDSVVSKVGCSRFLLSDATHEHVLHWMAVEGIVCLRQISTHGQQLLNSCVCIRLGASDLLEMTVSSKETTAAGQRSTVLCFVQQDGTVRILDLVSDKNSSILEPLVMSNEGGLVNFGGTVSSEIALIGSTSRKHPGVSMITADTSSCSVTAYAGAVSSIPADRDIETAVWSSTECLLLGLSHGDVLLVQLKRAQEDGISSLQLREHVLRDRGSGLKALWSEFMGGAADSNCDTICLASHAASALAVNRSGELRQWNIGAAALVSQTSLFDLLDAVGAVTAVVPSRAGASATSAGSGQGGSLDRNIHLQECVLRLAEDKDGASTAGDRYLLGALAVLPEELAGGLSNLTGHPVPANEQRWQILLVAWKEASEASMRPSEKVKMVARPVKFPVGSLVLGPRSAGEHSSLIGFRYSSAALVDVQLSVDSQRGVATVVSVWRAVATRAAGEEQEQEQVVLEGLVCRSTLQLTELRAQGYTPPGSTGAGPRSLGELAAASEMEVTLESAAHERHRLLSEDRAMLSQAEDAWAGTDLADQKALSRAEAQLKAAMLQRIFLPRRFPSRAICAGYDVFRARNGALWADEASTGAWGAEESKGAERGSIALDKHTPVPELSRLALQLCERVAKAKFSAAGATVLGRSFHSSTHRPAQEEHEVRWRQQFLQYLGETFSEFIADCDMSSRRLEALNAGCTTVCAVGNDTAVIVKALRSGDIALVTAAAADQPGGDDEVQSGEACAAAADMMSVIGDRFDADVNLQHVFLSLDCLVAKMLQTGDLSEASVEWIPQYFASLAPRLTVLLPRLLDLLQAQSSGDISPFEALVHLCALPTQLQCLLASSDCAFSELLCQGPHGARPAETGATALGEADALYQHALQAIRRCLLKCKLALTLLTLVIEVGQPLLHADTYSDLRDHHIPAVVHNMLHCSLLLWLDARRPTDNHMLVNEVELASTFPLSAALSAAPAPAGNTPHAKSASAGVAKPDEGASVFENFVRHLHRTSVTPSVRAGGISDLFTAVQLSAHGELTKYLFRSGQYVSLSRWAALTQLAHAPITALALTLEKHDIGVDQLMVSVGRSRILITKLTAEYLELLRCQWYHLQRAPQSTSAPSAPLQALRMKVHELLTATRELNTLADSVLSSAVQNGDATLSPISCDRHRAVQGGDVARGLVLHLRSLWGTSAANLRHVGARRSRSVHGRLEGLLALADAVMYVGTVGKGASLLALLVDSSAAGQDVEAAARDLLANRLSELCRTLHLSSVSGVLEMLDRALFFLPRKEGSALAMDGALLLAEHVAGTLDAVTQRSGLDRQSCSHVLLAELHGSWSRVFEYSLLHGERYTEALDALLRVAELEEQRLLDAAALSAADAVPWKGCLRTLVAQACDMGQLGWLCSIPDRQLQGFAKQGFSLCAVIAATMEELAVTLDTPSAMNFNEANYFECLMVFNLSRGNYHDAARVMHKLLERKSSAAPSTELEAQVGYAAASLSSLEALPADQRFVLHKVAAGGRDRSGTAGMQCLDERQLSLLFAKKAGAAKVAFPSSSTPPLQQPESVSQLVVALCNAGRAHDALSLASASVRSAAAATSAPDCSSSPTAQVFSVPIIALAKQCIVGGPAAAAQVDFFLRAPFSTGRVPAEQAGEQQWKHLTALLDAVRHTNHGTDAHVVALRALLFFHRQHSAADGASAPLSLPRSLVDTLAGLSSPLSLSEYGEPAAPHPSAGDPSLLLRLLLEFDCREEACLLGARLLSAANDELLQSPAVSRGAAAAGHDLSGWLPYPTLDLLIAHCELPRPNDSCGSELRKREREALDRLKETLEHHFSLWLFR